MQHFGVPEAHDAKALAFQMRRADFIRRAVGVLTAIDLDDEAAFKAHEIENVAIERNLAPELMAAELAHS